MGGLDLLNQALLGWLGGGMAQQLALLAAFALISGLIDLPLSLAQTFGVEQRFGFNQMTWKLWLSDLLKSVGSKNAECNGKIESGTGLRKSCRSKAYDHLAIREGEAAVFDRATNAILGLTKHSVRKSDNRETLPPPEDLGLNVDANRFDSDQSSAF